MSLRSLWPAVTWPDGDSAAETAAHATWQRLAERAPAASSAYGRERIGDIMVLLEGMLLDLALPCTAPAEPARSLAAALTAWRVSRDILTAQAQAASLLGEPVAAPAGKIPAEAELMAACLPHLAAGLPALLRHIDELASGISADNLQLATRPSAEVARVAGTVWAEDFTLDTEPAEAGLGWLLEPVSSAHACMLIAAEAVKAPEHVSLRAATIARRWAYSRVRSETIEGLSSKHVDKTRVVISALPR
jgi:hypothetical protein